MLPINACDGTILLVQGYGAAAEAQARVLWGAAGMIVVSEGSAKRLGALCKDMAAAAEARTRVLWEATGM